jgi:hypothetical protein
VTSSTLTLRKVSGSGQGLLALHNVTAPWVETTVTWNTFASAFDLAVAGSVAVSAVPAGGYACPGPRGWSSRRARPDSRFRPLLDVCYMSGR